MLAFISGCSLHDNNKLSERARDIQREGEREGESIRVGWWGGGGVYGDEKRVHAHSSPGGC